MRFKLTPGNVSDTPELIGLIEGLPGQELLADKAYDSDVIVQEAIDRGMEVVIPPKAKIFAVGMMSAMLAYLHFGAHAPVWAVASAGAVMTATAVYIVTRPNRRPGS